MGAVQRDSRGARLPAAVYAGKAGDLVEFICTFIQKKVGIMAAVVEVRLGVRAALHFPSSSRRSKCLSLAKHFSPSLRAMLQMGYNFLYGLWKYQWDADCELFLKILQVWLLGNNSSWPVAWASGPGLLAGQRPLASGSPSGGCETLKARGRLLDTTQLRWPLSMRPCVRCRGR